MRRGKHLDMNERSISGRLPPNLNFTRRPTNPSAASDTNGKDLVCLVDYAVYQLCMKQLHGGALGLGWKPNG